MATHILEAIRQNGVTFGYRPNKWTGKKLHNQFGSSSTNKPVKQWQHDAIHHIVTNRTNFVRCTLDSKKPDRDMTNICHAWRPAPNAPAPPPTFYERNRKNWFRR